MKSAAVFATVVLLLMTAFLSRSSAVTVQLGAEDEWQQLDTLPTDLASARALIDDGKAKKAQKLIKKWIEAHPDDPAMDHALFLKGNALFERKFYYQAFEAYDQLLEEFSTTTLFRAALRQHVEIAQRFLGGEKRRVWGGLIKVDGRAEGLEILDKVAERWPGSELAAEALMIQGDDYYTREQYLEAQSSYQLVVDSYVQSSHFPRAMLRNAEATQMQYAGADYDDVCLDDALVRYGQYRRRFPELAQSSGIDQRIEEIRGFKAEKALNIADFYRRTHRSASARYYWGLVVEGWPGTTYAQQARQLLADYPGDVPMGEAELSTDDGSDSREAPAQPLPGEDH